MSTYPDGFHFYGDDMGWQVEARHFRTHLVHDLHQCVIYDPDKLGARLIGIEHIISRRWLCGGDDRRGPTPYT